MLDEAAELLGEDDEPARRAAAVAASERALEEDYARGVLEMTGVAGLTAGALIEQLGYVSFYLLTTVAALPGILLFLWMMRSGLVDRVLESRTAPLQSA